MCNPKKCAQVHELPQSHCNGNWEGTLFSWLHNYIYIMHILLLWDLNTWCVTDHLWPFIHSYLLPASELLSFWACFGLLVPAMCNHTSCAQVHVLPKSHCGDNWDGKQIVIYIYIHIDIWISYHCLLSVYYFPEIFQTTKLKSHSHFSLYLYLLWFTTLQLPCRSSLVGLRLVLISL